MQLIQNAIFSVEIDLKNGCFSIHSKDQKFPSLENIRLGCTYKRKGVTCLGTQKEWYENGIEQKVIDTPQHGKIEVIDLLLNRDDNGTETRLVLGVVQEYPLVVWKMLVSNNGTEPVEMQKIEVLRIHQNKSGKIHYPAARQNADLGFFTNGWQSWSLTGWYPAESKMNISKLGFLQHPMIYNTGTPLPRKKGVFSSDMFAVIGDRVARTGFLVGFLSQRNHFGTIVADFNRGSLEMWANGDEARLEPGSSVETDWAVYNPILLDHRDPLDKYLEAVARENNIRIKEEIPVGWCSWYYFYTTVTALNIEKNLHTIVDGQNRLPIQLVQIDDGFESEVGDWFSFKPTFPEGVAPLAKKISHEGLVPGLWLTPFIVNPKSKLMKDHPDWILRKKNGKPVNAGFGWNTLTTALDLSNPEALAYACEVCKTASVDWGFSYLKLDFIYSTSLSGKYHDPTKTRAQVLRNAMESIRLAVGDKVDLLGCGAPLGSMLGIVDLMRIGPDVSGSWEPEFHGIKAFIHSEPSFPCARNSIRNILTRANLHRHWWVNDPDCLLIRADSNLTLDEVKSLATSIAMTGGSILLSDDLPRLPAERLAIAEALLPVVGERGRVVDWFDSEMPSKVRLDLLNDTGEWHLLALFNWHNSPTDLEIRLDDFHLNEGKYFTREFWSGKIDRIDMNTTLKFTSVPPHGCVLLAVRRWEKDMPIYLGSTFHFSQGTEVAEWRVEDDRIQTTLRLQRKASGEVLFHIPQGIKVVEVNGEPSSFKEGGSSIFSIPVEVDGFAQIEILTK